MAVVFFPSNPAQSAAVQAQFGANAAVDVARIRAEEARAIAQAQLQAQQQERFWRAQQQQQANDLNRQQLASEDFFRRGQLTNASEATKAKMAAATADNAFLATENEKNRVNQFNIAGLPRGQDSWRSQELGVDQKMFADAVNNFAALLNQKEELGSAKTQIDTADKLEKNRSPIGDAAKRAVIPIAGPALAVSDFFKNSGARKNAPFAALPYNYPANPDLPVADNIKGATAFFDQKLSELDRIIEAGQKEGLGSHVSRGPDGKWIPTLRASPVSAPAPAAQFLNAPTNAPVVVPPMTNAPVGQYFNSPAVGTNLPPIIKFDPRSGRPIAYDAVTKQAIGYAN